MTDWPKLNTITELREFPDLIGYYRKFVHNYRLIARPLTQLLKKGQLEWNPATEEAFTKLKQVMTSTPTLALSNFNEPFTIQTKASGEGIGAVLT